MEKETWKTVDGYEYHQVSNLGRARSLDHYDKRGHLWKGKILKPMKDPNGYLKVRLSDGEKSKTFNLHRLILMTFQPLEDYTNIVCDHIDCNRQNNNLTNLRWMTYINNLKRRNLNTEAYRNKGSKSRKIVKVYKNNSLYKEFKSIAECADYYNVSSPTIRSWINGYMKGQYKSKKTGKTKFYKWKCVPYDETLTFVCGN